MVGSPLGPSLFPYDSELFEELKHRYCVKDPKCLIDEYVIAVYEKSTLVGLIRPD